MDECRNRIQHMSSTEARKLLILLQIWAIPNKRSRTKIHQLKFHGNAIDNEFQQIVSPNPNDEGSHHWFHLETHSHPEKNLRTIKSKRRKWSLRFATIGQVAVKIPAARDAFRTQKLAVQLRL